MDHNIMYDMIIEHTIFLAVSVSMTTCRLNVKPHPTQKKKKKKGHLLCHICKHLEQNGSNDLLSGGGSS